MREPRTYEITPGNTGQLGVRRNGSYVNAALTAPKEASVSLLLYKKGAAEPSASLPFTDAARMGEVRAIRVRGISLSETEYNFCVDGNVVTDPYAVRIAGRESFGVPADPADMHAVRCGFVTASYDWEGDVPLRLPYEDSVLYNLHVRSFTMQPGSGVRHRGTFAGVREKAGYLAALGITQVKLMPAYEFDEFMFVHGDMAKYLKAPDEKKLNCWGYLKGNYFAPKTSYAAAKDPVREFKDMVKALHAAGIEVLMDFYFPSDVPPRTVTDCLLYWVREYHVDGFRLLGDAFHANAAAREPALSDTKLLSTWFPEEEIYGSADPAFRNLAECNDGFLIDARNFLRGREENLADFTWRMRRNPRRQAVVNYIAGHDGFTLCDLVSYEKRHNEENGEQGRDGCAENRSWNCGEEGPTGKQKIRRLRKRQMKNALTMVLLSAGTPSLLAGDEFGNSQGGNNNPYCLDSPVTWLDWGAARRNKDLQAYVRKLIAFRKAHRILCAAGELKGTDTLSCGYPDISYHGERAWYGGYGEGKQQIGILYCGRYAGAEELIYIAYNMSGEDASFALPLLPEEARWYQALSTDGDAAKEEKPLAAEKSFSVPAHTVAALIGRK